MHTACSRLKLVLPTLLFGLPALLNANTTPYSDIKNAQTCIRLGSKPSLIVKFKQQTINQNDLQKISMTGLEFIKARPMSNNNYIVFFEKIKGLNSGLEEVRPGCYSQETINKLLQRVKQQKNIEDASPNVIRVIGSLSNNTFEKPIVSDDQWALLNPPGGIDAENAWYNSQTTGNSKLVVAILDTGVYYNQALLPNQLPGVSFTNNGTYKKDALPSCTMSENCFGEPSHGTHVSGIAACSAKYANGRFVYGIAPTSKFVPVNVFTKETADVDCLPESKAPCIVSLDADLINAINWVSGEFKPAGLPKPPSGIVAINMSLGSAGKCPSIVQKTINTAVTKGINIVVSAMNANIDTATVSPASCKNVIPVASTGPSGEKAAYSNWGATVKVAAPGGNHLNPYYPGNPGEILSTYSEIAPYYGYAYLEGTSMAAPLVTGLIALLYSVDPKLTPAKVRSILSNKNALTPFPTASEVPPGTQSCVDSKHPKETCGAGIINARKAVELVRKLAS